MWRLTRINSRFHETQYCRKSAGESSRTVLNIKVHMNHWGVLLKCKFFFRSWGQGLRFCSLSKLPGGQSGWSTDHTLRRRGHGSQLSEGLMCVDTHPVWWRRYNQGKKKGQALQEKGEWEFPDTHISHWKKGFRSSHHPEMVVSRKQTFKLNTV